MLFLATTKMRQMKMAEPSMLTAHTSGSARSVLRRQKRVVAAPMTTPNSPVTQVIAPKIRLQETTINMFKIQCYKPNGIIIPASILLIAWIQHWLVTCLCCCKLFLCRLLLPSAPPVLGTGRWESTFQTHRWQMTPLLTPGTRTRSSGWWRRNPKSHTAEWAYLQKSMK